MTFMSEVTPSESLTLSTYTPVFAPISVSLIDVTSRMPELEFLQNLCASPTIPGGGGYNKEGIHWLWLCSCDPVKGKHVVYCVGQTFRVQDRLQAASNLLRGDILC